MLHAILFVHFCFRLPPSSSSSMIETKIKNPLFLELVEVVLVPWSCLTFVCTLFVVAVMKLSSQTSYMKILKVYSRIFHHTTSSSSLSLYHNPMPQTATYTHMYNIKNILIWQVRKVRSSWRNQVIKKLGTFRSEFIFYHFEHRFPLFLCWNS